MNKFNKKGLMVKFLTTVILALVIFVPACMVVSKLFFRLSDQSSNNFKELTTQLQDFAGSRGEKPKSFVLITDSETGIFLFVSEGFISAYSSNTEFKDDSKNKIVIRTNYYFHYPAECNGKIPCLCLCRKFGEGKGIPENTPGVENTRTEPNEELSCQSLTCNNIEGRYLPWTYYRSDSGERRTVLNFLKEDDAVKVVS